MSAQSVPPVLPIAQSPAKITAEKIRMLADRKKAEATGHAPAFPVLGELITCLRLKGVMITKGDLIARLEKFNLPTNQVPKKVQTRSQVLRTLAELVDSGFVTKKSDDAVRAVYVWVDDSVSKSVDELTKGDAFGRVEMTFEHHKRHETLTASDPAYQPLIDNLMSTYADKFITVDVRHMLIDMLNDHHSVLMRPEGGVYLIPDVNKQFATNLVGFVESLGPECYMSTFTIPDTADHQVNAAKSFTEQFRAEYANRMAEIAKYKENGNTREGKIGRAHV